MNDKIRKRTRKKSGAPMGRPPHVYSPEVLELFEKVAPPYTVTQICEAMGTSTHVFYKWLKDEPDFADAVKRVRAKADDQVVNALYQRSIGYTQTVYEEKLDKEGGVHALSKELHVAPDPGAAMNWLKNRDPEQWSDKRQIEIKGDFAERVDALVKAMEAGEE